MRVEGKTTVKIEYGDFQTPTRLAKRVCCLLGRMGLQPASLVEPTCGTGSFVIAGLAHFPHASKALAVDINPEYVAELSRRLGTENDQEHVQVLQGDFFTLDWNVLLQDLPEPVLVIGNPPWVTNSVLGSLKSQNVPKKRNFLGLNGIDAITGKSNFDVSEWMLMRIIDWFGKRRGAIAMLCKTAVARKFLRFAWTNSYKISEARIHRIDADAHFGVTVDACLLVCLLDDGAGSRTCKVFASLEDEVERETIGISNKVLIANEQLFRRWQHLQGESAFTWRSGMKHDCSSIMELTEIDSQLRNGLGEIVDIESDLVFPLLKGSDLANGCKRKARKFVIVTQKSMNDDTERIREMHPRTWSYLMAHADALDRRASAIYKNRPRFSVFGVGGYTFSPYKVGISALYKKLGFRALGSVDGKPIVTDDTCNFIPCSTAEEAHRIAELLNSQVAKEFFNSFIFWDEKRPITVQVLKRLSIELLAAEVGGEHAAGAALPLFAKEAPADYLKSAGDRPRS